MSILWNILQVLFVHHIHDLRGEPFHFCWTQNNFRWYKEASAARTCQHTGMSMQKRSLAQNPSQVKIKANTKQLKISHTSPAEHPTKPEQMNDQGQKEEHKMAVFIDNKTWRTSILDFNQNWNWITLDDSKEPAGWRWVPTLLYYTDKETISWRNQPQKWVLILLFSWLQIVNKSNNSFSNI